MESLSNRQEMGRLLDHASQDSVMQKIPQFWQADTHNSASCSHTDQNNLHALVFNMERGVHLNEIIDFLKFCPETKPFDIILANELDDGCVRSGQLNIARELAESLGCSYAFGLEFVELATPDDHKGFHGNAIFSRFPILKAKVVRLPEAYNWYFDRQKRIGGRLAVLAELDIGGTHIGVGTVHLENRTDSEGRKRQLKTVLDAAERMFPGMPVILGGDLNTNTFDGRDIETIQKISADPELQKRCLQDVFSYEACLPLAVKYGYRPVPDQGTSLSELITRRKPLPDGSYLGLRLDWVLVRDVTPVSFANIDTFRENWDFAPAGSALACFGGQELSDHNVIRFSGTFKTTG